MKRLRPNFQRLQRIVSVGFLAAIAGVFVTPAVHATGIPSPPPWVPYEIQAIGLCALGMRQESSDPQAAVTTLRQAREESTVAITRGGSGSPAVMHNDQVIAQELLLAQEDATKTQAQVNKKATETQKSGNSNNPVRPMVHHNQVAVKVR